MNNKQRIRINETQLRQIVSESVKAILNEYFSEKQQYDPNRELEIFKELYNDAKQLLGWLYNLTSNTSGNKEKALAQSKLWCIKGKNYAAQNRLSDSYWNSLSGDFSNIYNRIGIANNLAMNYTIELLRKLAPKAGASNEVPQKQAINKAEYYPQWAKMIKNGQNPGNSCTEKDVSNMIKGGYITTQEAIKVWGGAPRF